MMCPYEPGTPIDDVKRLLGLHDVIKLASNENPLGPSPRALDALNRSDLALATYPDNEGHLLREAVAARLGRPPASIILGAGSAELMKLVADAYLERGDEGIVADLCFPVYEKVIRIAGATPVEVPLDDELDYDLDRMLAAVTPRTKVVFIASPNNPTGRVIPAGDLGGFVDRLPPRVLCVLDLAYHEYAAAAGIPDQTALLDRHPNLVVLRTFSKVYGLAGLRIGYAATATDVAQWLSCVRTPFNTSSAAQMAARAALEDEAHLDRSVTLNRASLGRLANDMDALGLRVRPSQANFALVEVPRDPEDVFQILLRRGVIVRPMRNPRLPGTVRITTGTAEQMATLAGAMREALSARAPAPWLAARVS